MEKLDITGIVLAGGKSSRMGTDKSLMILNGKTLIQQAIDILHPLCGKVVISSNDNKFDFTGCEVWPDEYPIQAPLIGIYSCLKRSSTDINLVLSCDMPNVNVELLSFMLNNLNSYETVVPEHNNLLEPLCGIYRKSVLPVLEDTIKNSNYKLMELLKKTSALYLEIKPEHTFYTKDLFVNINTKEDFNKLQNKTTL